MLRGFFSDGPIFRSILIAIAPLLFGDCKARSATKAPVDAGVDSAASDLVEDCSAFVDRRDPSADRTLVWQQAIADDDDRCMQIKVGQSVSWSDGSGGIGDFTNHPLIAFEGDDNNPIQQLDYDTGIVTFNAPGTFGYVCGTHPAMKGAIKVSAQ